MNRTYAWHFIFWVQSTNLSNINIKKYTIIFVTLFLYFLMYQETYKIEMSSKAPTKGCALLWVATPSGQLSDPVLKVWERDSALLLVGQRFTPAPSIARLPAPLWHRRGQKGSSEAGQRTYCTIVFVSSLCADAQLLQVSIRASRGPQGQWNGGGSSPFLSVYDPKACFPPSCRSSVLLFSLSLISFSL